MQNDKLIGFKRNMQGLIAHIRYLFHPFFNIGCCIVCVIVLDFILGIPMFFIRSNTTMYDILFALVTGVTASFGVSICMEISNNYRQNKRRSLELEEYFGVFWDFETTKKIKMGDSEFIGRDKKVHDELLVRDEVQATWEQLPKIMPVFTKTLNEKREFLEYKELNTLKSIHSEFEMIQRILKTYLLPGMLDAKILDKDEEFSNSWIPKNLKDNLSEEYMKQLCNIEFDQAFQKVVDKIFANETILSVALENEIFIGEKYLKLQEEDIFVEHIEECDEEKLEAHERMVYSRLLSQCCKNILDEIEELEKIARKEPIVGYMLKQCR